MQGPLELLLSPRSANAGRFSCLYFRLTSRPIPDARSYAHGLHVRKSIFGIFSVYALSRYALISYRDVVCSCLGQRYALHR